MARNKNKCKLKNTNKNKCKYNNLVKNITYTKSFRSSINSSKVYDLCTSYIESDSIPLILDENVEQMVKESFILLELAKNDRGVRFVTGFTDELEPELDDDLEDLMNRIVDCHIIENSMIDFYFDESIDSVCKSYDKS